MLKNTNSINAPITKINIPAVNLSGFILFTSSEIKNIDTIELHHFTGSVENFIKTVKPDAVLILYNSALPGRDAKPSATKREKKFFDFR